MVSKPVSKNISLLESLLVFLVVFVSIFRILTVAKMRGFNCDSIPNQAGYSCYFPFPWFILLCLLAACGAGIFVLFRTQLWQDYWQTWKQSWLVILLLGLALLSTLWSIFPTGTLYTSAVLIMVSFLAAFIGVRRDLREVLGIFAWAMGSLAVICLAAVIFFPQGGIMSAVPYIGSWSGVLWHRNYLGTLMALGSMIFLVRFLESSLSRSTRNTAAVFYFICLMLVAGSRSATGIILAALLSGACLIFFTWLKLRTKLNRWHYWTVALAGFALMVLAVWKMDSLLAVLGRNSSFTGRIPLWNYLLVNFIAQKPWLGYGYGVFWSFESVRAGIQAALGWMYPVLIGDNGWMDIALHLGMVGVVLFTLILIRFGIFAFKKLKIQPDMLSFFPAGLLLFIIVGNLTLSLFLELEFITWLMLVTTQFAIISDRWSDSS
jgi:exopolysaccharide production protein ExoQ